MLQNTISWIWNHQLTRHQRLQAYSRWLWWQGRSRITQRPFRMPWVNGSVLMIEPGMHGATGNFYAGLHEWPDMAFVLHLLRPDDHFFDIGSNVGSYTVLASAVIGAKTTAIEPTPQALSGLRSNLIANHIQDSVAVVEACVGASRGEVLFSIDRGPMNGVVHDNYNGMTRTVPQLPLDHLPTAAQACCWKVDVEGFEADVLEGAHNSLAGPAVQAVLLEDRSAAVDAMMTAGGFTPCSYNPFARTLATNASSGSNQIWIRDINWVADRLRTAPAFAVNGLQI